ncbi:unnamed protein product [Prorocentrum cordatum]|uniref:Uncharacterized protein n=1 Tax=Prorocentrum cordatum TaxID=2364126 RepID=A0ABN9Q585_9DINO|nr:unnamed protein product [Polarella glacialis]
MAWRPVRGCPMAWRPSWQRQADIRLLGPSAARRLARRRRRDALDAWLRGTGTWQRGAGWQYGGDWHRGGDWHHGDVGVKLQQLAEAVRRIEDALVRGETHPDAKSGPTRREASPAAGMNAEAKWCEPRTGQAAVGMRAEAPMYVPLPATAGVPVPAQALKGAAATAATWCWLPEALPPPASAAPVWWPQPSPAASEAPSELQVRGVPGAGPVPARGVLVPDRAGHAGVPELVAAAAGGARARDRAHDAAAEPLAARRPEPPPPPTGPPPFSPRLMSSSSALLRPPRDLPPPPAADVRADHRGDCRYVLPAAAAAAGAPGGVGHASRDRALRPVTRLPAGAFGAGAAEASGHGLPLAGQGQATAAVVAFEAHCKASTRRAAWARRRPTAVRQAEADSLAVPAPQAATEREAAERAAEALDEVVPVPAAASARHPEAERVAVPDTLGQPVGSRAARDDQRSRRIGDAVAAQGGIEAAGAAMVAAYAAIGIHM